MVLIPGRGDTENGDAGYGSERSYALPFEESFAGESFFTRTVSPFWFAN